MSAALHRKDGELWIETETGERFRVLCWKAPRLLLEKNGEVRAFFAAWSKGKPEGVWISHQGHTQFVERKSKGSAAGLAQKEWLQPRSHQIVGDAAGCG